MVQKKPAKFYRENMPAPNSPDIKPVDLWSIMDEVAYEDPTPKTIKDLKRRLKQAWKKTRSPRYMTYLIPCRNGFGT